MDNDLDIFRKREEKKKKKKKKLITPIPYPRYDDVYYKGVGDLK